LVFIPFLVFVFLFLLLFLFNGIIIYWLIFFLITFFFLVLMKIYRVNGLVMFNYFFIQEILGILFLISTTSLLQLFYIMMKLGVSPFHYWVFYIQTYLTGFLFIWFLFYHKLPFLYILVQLLIRSYEILFLGLVFLYLQILIVRSLTTLLIISSLESFNWLILMLSMRVINFFHLFLLYYISYLFSYRGFSYNQQEVILTILMVSLPLVLTFFIKFFVLNFNIRLFILILMLIISIAVISISYNIIYYLLSVELKNIRLLFYIPVSFLTLILFYIYFKKNSSFWT
jgi:hypothetical protein